MLHEIELWMSAMTANAVPVWALWTATVVLPALLAAVAVRPIKAYRAKRLKKLQRFYADRFANLIGDYRKAVTQGAIELVLEDQTALVEQVKRALPVTERESLRPVLKQLDLENANAVRRVTTRVPGQSLAPFLPVPVSIAPAPGPDDARPQVAAPRLSNPRAEEVEWTELLIAARDNAETSTVDKLTLVDGDENDVHSLIESGPFVADDMDQQLDLPWSDPADLTPIDPYLARAVADTQVVDRTSILPDPADDTLTATRAEMMLPPPPAHQNDLEPWDERQDNEVTAVFHLDTLRLVQDDDLVPGNAPVEQVEDDPVVFYNPKSRSMVPQPPTSEEERLAKAIDELDPTLTPPPRRLGDPMDDEDDSDTMRPAPADEESVTMRPAASDGVSYTALAGAFAD